MSLVSNQTAIQNFVDENTTGLLADGQRVSLIFNDVALNGAPQVLVGGVVSSLPVSSGEAEAYTLTFDTTDRTLPAATAAVVVTTAPTTTTPYGYTTSAQAAAIVTEINALVADVASLREVVAALVTDLAAFGIVAT